MLVSLNWLKELVDIDADPQVLARRLTDTGAEVEDTETPAPMFRGAVTARVESLEKHPAKGGLIVARVSAEGRKGVCVTAAANLAAGDLVPWGPPGCTLADGAVLGPRDFEGVVSDGMMLSADEIGFPDLAAEFGILRLDSDMPVGVDVRKVLGLDDVVFDVAITPNRGDLLSMTGMAREVYGVIADSKLKRYDLPVPGENRTWSVDFRGVTLSDPDCPVYGLGLTTGIRIAPSPVSVRMRLILAGMRPISNIVDATNLMMLMTGQPLHAFDADRLPAPEITVRSAKNGEKIVTLDEKERLLTEDDLVISSGGEAIGLAGVMGGANSEIWEGTRNVLLESAHFRGPRVSRTYRRLGLASEAAYRFARTVDP
ncbi:MAG: phenylalanine--tRNA ligase subunit beta, partial [Synergistota bacterium]|nr:phenylalanine--tRNA ligase subunit beta [Synergistota bacterium]